MLHAAEAGLLLAVLGLFAVPTPLPVPLALLYVLYFVGLQLYVAAAFVREARRTSGVTSRRMQSAAWGSALLGLAILFAGLTSAIMPWKGILSALGDAASLLAGLAYVLGFAPPSVLRRAWQEPELRAFLGRAASLPRLPDTEAIVREIERGTADALGAPQALVALWEEQSDCLRYYTPEGILERPSEYALTGVVFTSQRAVFSDNAVRDDPDNAELYRRTNAIVVLAAPITSGQRRLGVLTAYDRRGPPLRR